MEVRAAIGATRDRLARRLTRTANHVHFLFTAPSSAEADARDGGFIGSTVYAIAVAGRTRRAWRNATTSGVLRRAAIGAAAVAFAVAVATRTRRR